MNTQQKKTGAMQTLDVLQKLGITDIFGYPGGAIMPMYDAIYSSTITHYLCRHEQGAAFAAVGYARASGKVGVCLATSGPGATNLITGLADAMADSIPVVAITGQVPTRAMGSDGFQEVDIISLSLACTKHSFIIKNIADLPECIHKAFEIAVSGRPGPVLIDIPKDIQSAEVQAVVNEVTESFTNNKKDSVKSEEVATQNYKQAIELIECSQRPLFYVGGGVGIANALNELNQLMTWANFPSVTTIKGLGAVHPNNPLYLGMLGMHGSKAANLAIQECDLMIVLGARFDDRATGKLTEFAPHAKVLHMDIDPAEINKRRLANVAILGDLKDTLNQLNNQILSNNIQLNIEKLSGWKIHCTELNNHPRPYDEPTHIDSNLSAEPETDSKLSAENENDNNIFAPTMLRELSDQLAKSKQPYYVTTDVGQHQMWSAQHMQFTNPCQFITSSGLGTMGFGVPAAIGAQISHPKAQVVCVSGDGSFMMNIQELGTIKRYQIPVKILLINNSRLGLVRQWQQLFFEERYSETDLSDNPDFEMLAKSFEITAETITDKKDVTTAISRMLNHQGAYLLQIKINEQENVWPLVPPDTANHEMMVKVKQGDERD
jgi:acetolactate synthase-1/2/3 large subunit